MFLSCTLGHEDGDDEEGEMSGSLYLVLQMPAYSAVLGHRNIFNIHRSILPMAATPQQLPSKDQFKSQLDTEGPEGSQYLVYSAFGHVWSICRAEV